jgi:RNA-dependent RNA polymerase
MHVNLLPDLRISATEPSITINPSEFEAIEDIISEETGSCFTDGVGTISPELAEEVWTMLCASRRTKTRRVPPSAYQIRIGGHKGVVVRDHTLSGRKIRLRPSMKKFDADSTILEISMSFERPMTTHLNR